MLSRTSLPSTPTYRKIPTEPSPSPYRSIVVPARADQHVRLGRSTLPAPPGQLAAGCAGAGAVRIVRLGTALPRMDARCALLLPLERLPRGRPARTPLARVPGVCTAPVLGQFSVPLYSVWHTSINAELSCTLIYSRTSWLRGSSLCAASGIGTCGVCGCRAVAGTRFGAIGCGRTTGRRAASCGRSWLLLRSLETPSRDVICSRLRAA